MPRQPALERFRRIMKDFGRTTGMGEIEVGEDCNARLVFNDSLEVDIEGSPDQSALYMHGVVSRSDALRGGGEGALFFLHASLFHPRARGGSFSFDREMQEVVLFRCLPLQELSLTVFEDELMQFVDALDYWREAVQRGAALPARREAAQGEAGASHAIKA